MMTFEEFSEHMHGTYVNVKLSEEDKDKLYNWVVDNDISNPLNKDEYHCTIVYSKKPCPGATEYDFNLPVEANIVGWKIFDAGIGRCLVAALHSEGLQKINTDMKEKYGATSDFPEYIPHITVSYDYQGEIPQNYPAFKVSFTESEVRGLDPDWKPTK